MKGRVITTLIHSPSHTMDRSTKLPPSHNEEDEKQFTDFLFGDLETDTPAVLLFLSQFTV